MVDESKLIQRVAEGDRTAFLRLYERYAAKVHGLSLHVLRDPGDAEENAQDAFLRLWERAESFRPERGTLLTWLLTITRRLAIDRLRHDSRRIQPAHSLDEDWLSVPDPQSETEEARWHSLAFALRALPRDQRQTIELAYYYGMSQRQVAEVMDVPLGTVKTRIRLGMEKLRIAMREEPVVGKRSKISDRSVG
jgi:RNA polymerase sigma-70 factor (ECF subfamily)